MTAAAGHATVSPQKAQKRLPVLLYHHVGPRRAGTNRWLTVTPTDFRRQVAWLARHGYTGIRSSEWLAYLRHGRELPQKPVLLTFDDGYRDLSHYAFPVLREFGFSGLVFMVTALIGKTNEWDRAEFPTPHELLDAEAVRHWAAAGIEFGAHSRTHPDLRSLSGEALKAEVAGSGADLQALLGEPVCSFAYPYGFFHEGVRAAVEAAFPLCFSVEEGNNNATSDPLHIHRTMVLPADTTLDIRFRVRWGWSPIGAARGLAARARNRLLGRDD